MTSTEAITGASKRIANITGALSSDEVTFRFGIAVKFINAAREFNAVDEVVWERLLESAEHANDSHPMVSVKPGDSSEL